MKAQFRYESESAELLEAEQKSKSCETTLSYEYHLTTVDAAREQIESPDLSALPAVVIAEPFRSREHSS